MKYVFFRSCVVAILLWSTVEANATCEWDGKQYPDNTTQTANDGSQRVCNGTVWTTNNSLAPYQIKSAEFRNFDAPSQQPRCHAKQGIKSVCANNQFCRLEMFTTLCAQNNRIDSATHIEIVWKCEKSPQWNLQRIPIGTYWTLDCREK